MSPRTPRFELARTDHGWTARFVASNGKVIMSTGSQAYSKRSAAINAIECVSGQQVQDVEGRLFITRRLVAIEVRQVDERGQS